MKLTAAFILAFLVIPQDNVVLKNFYSSSFEMYGGTEDSGITRTEEYFFITRLPILLPDLFEEGEPMELNPGDTLVIVVSSHRSYGGRDPEPLPPEPKPPSKKKKFRISHYNGKIYAHLQYPFEWDNKLSYRSGKKNFVARTKQGFDISRSEAAP